jgi:NAD(P)-dependent dehydrogenase (short-subunit alcohol dehydrogenase family)
MRGETRNENRLHNYLHCWNGCARVFVTLPAKPLKMLQCVNRLRGYMDIAGKVAVITGAASGIGRAVAGELARRNVRALALVDIGDNINTVADEVNAAAGRRVAYAFRGDTTDDAFRASVFDTISSQFDTVTMCVPAAGITRDDLAVRVDKETGKARIYPVERSSRLSTSTSWRRSTGRSR